GVAYDDSTGILFATASSKNAVYQYTQGDGQWSTRVLAAGNPSGEALDTADGLNNPTVVRWYDGYLFIRVFDGVWQWKPFDSAATQTFGGIYVYGQRGLTVSPDNFVYYSKTNNKVYRKPISNPPDGPGDIFAGACGCGPESNQLCNSLESNLVTFTPSGQVIIQDYPELYGNPEDLSFRLVSWSPHKLSIPPCYGSSTISGPVTSTTTTSGPVTSSTTTTSGPVTSTTTTSGPVTSTTTTSGPVTSTTTTSGPVTNRTTFPDLLPPGQITTESFSFTDKGVWYLAGYSSDDGIRTLWRI
ncbi:hypothetical protein FOZ62_013396, partial [Perkinsus olseni]